MTILHFLIHEWYLAPLCAPLYFRLCVSSHARWRRRRADAATGLDRIRRGDHAALPDAVALRHDGPAGERKAHSRRPTKHPQSRFAHFNWDVITDLARAR